LAAADPSRQEEMRLGTLAAVLACAVVLAGSCGGDGGRLSYPEFQQRASAVCLRYHRRLAQLGAPSTLPKIAKVARGAYRLGRSERTQLAQLRPPEEAVDRYARMLDDLARADALLPSVWRAAEAKKIAVARRLIRRGRATVAAADENAVAIGLSDCRRS
jgi:hypothetical protein